MIKHIMVFDIDGVLLDSNHRYRIKDNRKIDLDYWRRHCVESEIMRDSPLPMATIYRKAVKSPTVYAVIATAREMTRHDWKAIAEKIGLPNHFIYRPKGNTESGAILKEKGLRRLLNLRQFAKAKITIFEDNIDYLNHLKQKLMADGWYIHSKQGF